MISLFIDTSSEDVSIAIVRDDKIIASRINNIPGKHSIYATSYLDEVIKEAKIDNKDIDNIMVVNGPGSFTGLRIGVAIAKVFAYLLKKGVICISSLKMMALSIKHDYCLTLLDARNNNYYMALYDKNNKEVIKPVFSNVDEVLELINKYSPLIVSNKEFEINSFKVRRVELDIVNIVKCYENEEVINSHLVVPDYLKLPQAMEDKNDKRN